MEAVWGAIESVEEAAEAFHRLIITNPEMHTVNAVLRALMPHNNAAFLNYLVKTKSFGYEPLISVASHLQNAPLVRRILQEGVDVNLNGTNGYTALIHACLAGNEEIARYLIATGANVNFYFDFKVRRRCDGIARREQFSIADTIPAWPTLSLRTQLYQVTPLGACLRYSTGAPDCAHTKLAKLLLDLGADVRTTFEGEGKIPRVKEILQSWHMLPLLDKS